MNAHPQVVLGLGGGVDFEVRLVGQTLSTLVADHGIRAEELGRSGPLVTERDLILSILSYLRTGGGGEHFVATAALLSSFAARFPHTITLGGTSVRAGIVMSRLGIPSRLHLVTVNDHVRRMLPADVDYVSSDEDDTLFPHLVAQYPAGLRVRSGDVDICAPFANRLIYVNDPANERLRLSPDLGELLTGASVFLISGLNAVREADLLDQRLAELSRAMTRLPLDALVYFEDAGYHRPEFSARVRAALLPRVGVFGLNEDEWQAHIGRPVDLLDPTQVAAGLADLQALMPVPIVVVHTKYWAVAVGDRADDYCAALDTAMAVASTRYGHGDAFSDADYRRVRASARRPDALALTAELPRLLRQVCCRAGFVVDVADPTTVGLGDSFVGGFLAARAGAAAYGGDAVGPGSGGRGF